MDSSLTTSKACSLSLTELHLGICNAAPDDEIWAHVRSCGRCTRASALFDRDIGLRAHDAVGRRASVVPPAVYKDRQPLKRGGMYQTYTALDRRVGRKVVLKQLPAGASAEGQDRRRLLEACLRREAHILARLRHPSIVTLLEAGEWEGSAEVFYAMELVDGSTLAETVARTSSLKERLGYLPAFVGVVNAVAHAHAHGVIHRDVSPNNIIIGTGVATLIDWTTARVQDPSGREGVLEGAELPSVGPTLSAAGTPGFAPAEQMTREHDHRVDVFALGASLSFLVGGRAPFTGATTEEILAAVRADHRQQPADAPGPLLAIIRKAMSFRPEDRYATARDLAADLERFLANQIVLAHQYSWMQRLLLSRAFARGLVAALFLCVLSIAGWREYRSAEREAARAANEADLAAREAEARGEATTKEADRVAAVTRAEEAEERQKKALKEAVDTLERASKTADLSKEMRDAMDLALSKARTAQREQTKASEERDAALKRTSEALAAQGKAEAATKDAQAARNVAAAAAAEADSNAKSLQAQLVAARDEAGKTAKEKQAALDSAETLRQRATTAEELVATLQEQIAALKAQAPKQDAGTPGGDGGSP